MFGRRCFWFRNKFVWLFVIIILVLASSVSQTQALNNKKCFECHGSREFKKRLKTGAEISLFIDEVEVSKSVHTDLECVNCHEDLSKVSVFPHRKIKSSVYCGKCHKQRKELYLSSIHGKAKESKIEDAPQCWHCHSRHDIKAKEDPDSLVYPKNEPRTCGKCHANGVMMEKYNLPSDILTKFLRGTHGKYLSNIWEEGAREPVVCTTCHKAHQIKSFKELNTTTLRFAISKICGDCHTRTIYIYKRGLHAKGLNDENPDFPTCVDCHGIHDVYKASQQESLTHSLNIDEKCTACHDDKEKMSKYGLLTNRLKTYRDTYHGKANFLGRMDVANCVDCHGYHDIRGKNDPESPINKWNIMITCGKCHPEERDNDNWVKGLVHRDVTSKDGYLILITKIIITWITVIFVIMAIFHIATDIRVYKLSRRKN